MDVHLISKGATFVVEEIGMDDLSEVIFAGHSRQAAFRAAIKLREKHQRFAVQVTSWFETTPLQRWYSDGWGAMRSFDVFIAERHHGDVNWVPMGSEDMSSLVAELEPYEEMIERAECFMAAAEEYRRRAQNMPWLPNPSALSKKPR